MHNLFKIFVTQFLGKMNYMYMNHEFEFLLSSQCHPFLKNARIVSINSATAFYQCK